MIKLTFWTLTYNDHFSMNYVFDTLMEPAIWFVDGFTKILGNKVNNKHVKDP